MNNRKVSNDITTCVDSTKIHFPRGRTVASNNLVTIATSHVKNHRGIDEETKQWAHKLIVIMRVCFSFLWKTKVQLQQSEKMLQMVTCREIRQETLEIWRRFFNSNLKFSNCTRFHAYIVFIIIIYALWRNNQFTRRRRLFFFVKCCVEQPNKNDYF